MWLCKTPLIRSISRMPYKLNPFWWIQQISRSFLGPVCFGLESVGVWCAWASFSAVVAAAVCVAGAALGEPWLSLCVAGVALGDIDRHFAWQAWHLVTSTFTLRGRRGTWRHRLSLCVAGVALGDIYLRLARQACTCCILLCIFHKQLCHTPSLTHNFVTQPLSHTTFHTPFTHNFVTHSLLHTTLSHTALSHTMFLCHTPSFTHNFVTHHVSHTTLSHTIFYTQLCHTLSFTHNFVTHHLSHTTSSHTIFHTQLCHTPCFTHTQLCHTPCSTHNFVTHHLSHTTLSHTIFHRQLYHTPCFFATHHLSHTTLSHTIFHTQLCHTPSFTHNFVTHHLSHTTLSHTTLHIQLVHTQLTHTQLAHTHTHHILCLSFPVPLQHLLLIIGRNWLVGLSGPLIFQELQWFIATSWDLTKYTCCALQRQCLAESVVNSNFSGVDSIMAAG